MKQASLLREKVKIGQIREYIKYRIVAPERAATGVRNGYQNGMD